MSRGLLKTVGTIAGAVAFVGSVALTAGGSAFAATALGGALGGAGGIVSVAGIVAGAAQIGAQALAKPPPVRGSVSQVLIQPDAPQPYVMGEGYFAGVVRHDVGYGPTLKKIPNPYRFMPVVYSGGGPVESISPRVDYSASVSWYAGFLYTDTQLGACPEPDALSPQWPGAPGWSSASKLSGQAAIGWSFKFDKDGKRFASGIPLIGAYGQWVKVYDPRKDSTQPGGSGDHRLGDESTYEYSDLPPLHAGTYAYGRYQNGKRTIGMGLPADGIDWAVIAAWANVCEANNWSMFGVVFEGHDPSVRWPNLKDICFAGGGEPINGAKLTFKYSAPKVALGTITVDDLTDDNRSITGMQPFRDRINTVVPKYRSPAHNWEMIDAKPVVNAGFLAEDGEEKRDVWPFNFVKELTQATQLSAYRMYDSRELPFTVPCKAHMRHFRAGECLEVIDPELGVNTLATIQRRHIDPATMKVTFEMITETVAKHAYCLGQTGVAPPTPAIGQTAQERDELASAATSEPRAARQIVNSTIKYPVTTTQTTAAVVAFTATIDSGDETNFPAATISGLTAATSYVVLWNLDTSSYSAVLMPALAALANPRNVIIRYVSTQSSDGSYPPSPTPPGGDSGGGYGGAQPIGSGDIP